MSKISPKNFAEAVHEATHGKSGAELELVLKRAGKILKNKRLLGKSKEILVALQGIVDKKTNTVRMKVTTAKKITQEERSKIEARIKEKYKAEKVVSEFFEKEELLGGMRVEVENEVLDNTYWARLQKLEKFLIQGK
ncbi:MAG: F0F1 ATP synthase subunit delta [bacterium]|nr:F0F1 ATP synthase subunit delta [bacterium]